MSGYPEALDVIIANANEAKSKVEGAIGLLEHTAQHLGRLIGMAEMSMEACDHSAQLLQDNMFTQLSAQEHAQTAIRWHDQANFTQSSDARTGYRRLLFGYQTIKDEFLVMFSADGEVRANGRSKMEDQKADRKLDKSKTNYILGQVGSVSSELGTVVSEAEYYKRRRIAESDALKAGQQHTEEAETKLKAASELQEASNGYATPEMMMNTTKEAMGFMRPLPEDIQTLHTRLAGLYDKYEDLGRRLNHWRDVAPQVPIPYDLERSHVEMGRLLQNLIGSLVPQPPATDDTNQPPPPLPVGLTPAGAREGVQKLQANEHNLNHAQGTRISAADIAKRAATAVKNTLEALKRYLARGGANT